MFTSCKIILTKIQKLYIQGQNVDSKKITEIFFSDVYSLIQYIKRYSIDFLNFDSIYIKVILQISGKANFPPSSIQ